MVHFVGAGSGAPDLITVRGARLISQTDVIIYAGSLVNPELLKGAREDCRLYNSAYMNLEQVLEVIREADAACKDVVRLHTGDPSIYGAIREQMDVLKEMGISYDICPGVSSMSGAAAALGCEYTLPGVSQTIIVTRRAGRTPVREEESLESLAAHGATMVIFLSIGLAEQVQEELIRGGYKPDTPAAIVYKATWPDERIIRCRLSELVECTKREGISKTALICVGGFLGDDYLLSKLYDKNFGTEYRKVCKGCENII